MIMIVYGFRLKSDQDLSPGSLLLRTVLLDYPDSDGQVHEEHISRLDHRAILTGSAM